jgi:hypothetical protein
MSRTFEVISNLGEVLFTGTEQECADYSATTNLYTLEDGWPTSIRPRPINNSEIEDFLQMAFANDDNEELD